MSLNAVEHESVKKALEEIKNQVLGCYTLTTRGYGVKGRKGKPSQLLMQAMGDLTVASAILDSFFMQEHPIEYGQAIMRPEPQPKNGKKNGQG